MKITREQVGLVLGYLIVATLILGLPYLGMSFISWSFDPAEWMTVARIAVVGIVFAATAIYFSDDTPTPLKVDDEEQR